MSSAQGPTPYFSVVIPCYRIEHRAKLVREVLRSVALQTFDDFELLVIDDGSPDDSYAVLQALIAAETRLVGRTHVLRLARNGGVCAARNAGIDAAVGKYVAFLDFDDLWFPGYLAEVAHAHRHARDGRVVLTRTYFARHLGAETRVPPSPSVESLNSLTDRDFDVWHLSNNFPVAMGSAIVVARSLFERVPEIRYDLRLSRTTAEDVLMGFQLLKHQIRPLYLDQPYCVHRRFYEFESRGTTAALRLDESDVLEYIEARATRDILERIRRESPESAAEIEQRGTHVRERFRIKNLVLRRDLSGLLGAVLTHPLSSGTVLRVIVAQTLSTSILRRVIDRLRFMSLRRDREATDSYQALLCALRA